MKFFTIHHSSSISLLNENVLFVFMSDLCLLDCKFLQENVSYIEQVFHKYFLDGQKVGEWMDKQKNTVKLTI